MNNTYYNCTNLTGFPTCGNNVTNMSNTYYNCYRLTGSPACGNNVTNMSYTYYNCYNLMGNAYFYSASVTNVRNCFGNRNKSNRLNIYTINQSTTMNTLRYNNSKSIVGTDIRWTNDISVNKCYYNTYYNIYIYPVDGNIEDFRLENEYNNNNISANSDNYINNDSNIIKVKTEYQY